MADHTRIGGVKGSFNDDEDPPPNAPRNPPESEPPVTHDSPWKLHFPAWRTMVLGSSGGVYKDTHTHLEG